MGRAFERRKERKFKRWGSMSRIFTKIGKEITIAVKQGGGADPDFNPRLRLLIEQAKKENMPKDNVERAIKRATDKDMSDYKEVVFEGYGPHGIAIVVETATDNNTRTVANVRSYFTNHGGSLGTSGSLDFMFAHKCLFDVETKEGVDMEMMELELIDYGVDEVEFGDDDILIYGAFTSFANIQSYLEENGFEINSAEFVRIPHNRVSLTDEQRAEVQELIDKFEEDDDVQNVFHNMEEVEE